MLGSPRNGRTSACLMRSETVRVFQNVAILQNVAIVHKICKDVSGLS